MNKALQIAIVEDNGGDFLILEDILRSSGIPVRHIEHYQRLDPALKKLPAATDLIFLDLYLPDSSGLDTFHAVNTAFPGIPVIVLSGLSDLEIAVQAIRAGAQDYLIKGEFDDKLLFKTVYYSIERKSMHIKLIDASENLSREQLLRQQQITEATIQAQEKEREELGNELHDNINQILATCKMCLDIGMKDDHLKEDLLLKAHSLLGDAIEEIRKLTKSLVPPSLSDMGLIEALRDLAKTLNVSNATKFTVLGDHLTEYPVPAHKQLMVYRIVQEQASNILKYASASEAVISVDCDDQFLYIDITDNGVGFDTSGKFSGIGLRNIRSRAELYKGSVTIESAPGKGCRVHVSIPV